MAVVFYANGEVLFDTEHPSPELALLSPKCKVETNRSGSASFTVLPTHWLHDSLERMKTVITIEEDGDVIFRGRIIDMPSDLFGQIRVTCEGDMGFLIDSVQEPYTGTQTVREFFTRVVNNHNNQVESWKRFEIGNVTITEADQSKEFKIDGYQKTSDLLNSELLQEYGGIIRTRTVGGVTYIDYVEDPFTSPNETVNSQEIRFAVNLVDYDEQYPINDLFTILLPLGRDNLTISSVNNGSIFLESAEAVAKYGKIYHMEQWSNISDASVLKTTGQTFLNGHARAFPNDLKVRAIDVHNIKKTTERIKMGDSVMARIDPRGISDVYYCLSIDYDFINFDNTEYWLGTFIPSDKQKGSTAESNYGGGGGGYGGESLSQSSASTSAKANKQQQELQETEQDIRINARSLEMLFTKTGAADIPDGSDSMYSRITADHSRIDAQVTKTTKLETDVGTLTITSEEIKQNVTNVTGNVNNLTTKVGSLEVTSESIVEEVSTARGTSDSLSARLTIVDNGIEARARETTALGTRMTTVETNVEGFTATVNGLDGRVTTLKETVDGIYMVGETIYIGGNSIQLDGTTLADKVFSQSLSTKTLSVGSIVTPNLTIGSNKIDFKLIGFSGIDGRYATVLATDSAALNLHHTHSLSFDSSQNSIIIGGEIAGDQDSASIALSGSTIASALKGTDLEVRYLTDSMGTIWNAFLQMGAIIRGPVARHDTSATVDLSHYHSISFAEEDGQIKATVGDAQGAPGTGSFSIAATSKYKTDVAAAETKGWDAAAGSIVWAEALGADADKNAIGITYPISGGSTATKVYQFYQNDWDSTRKKYIFLKEDSSTGNAVARVTITAPAMSLGERIFQSNGTYKASDYGLDGFSKVSVSVTPALTYQTFTANGNYSAPQGYEGWSTITVNVPTRTSRHNNCADDLSYVGYGSSIQLYYDGSWHLSNRSGSYYRRSSYMDTTTMYT